MSLHYLRITHQTAAVLDRVAEDVFDDAIQPEHLNAYLSAAGHALFVAVADGVVVGQARGILHFQPDMQVELYIDNLGVTPDFKRRGVGTGLVEALMEWARHEGCAVAWVATETTNEEARGFYEAFGFQGETMAYYFTEADDED